MSATARGDAGGGTVGAFGKTRRVVAAALAARDGRAAFLGTGVLYLVVFLISLGDIGPGRGRWGVVVVPDPLAKVLSLIGPFQFEAVALVNLGPITYLFSPGNLAVALVLAGLLGANAAVTVVSYRRPGACGIESSTALLGGIPALLGGAACCGPIVLFVVGIQATSAMLAVFDVLIPLAAVLLLGSLLFVSRRATFA